MFLFKNNIMSMFFGFSLFLLSLTSSPALENKRSDGTEEPGTARYLRARIFRFGKRQPLFFHHCSGSSCLSKIFSSKYLPLPQFGRFNVMLPLQPAHQRYSKGSRYSVLFPPMKLQNWHRLLVLGVPSIDRSFSLLLDQHMKHQQRVFF